MCKLELYLFYNGMKSLGDAAPFWIFWKWAHDKIRKIFYAS